MITARKTIVTLIAVLAVSLSANAFLGGMLVAKRGAMPPPHFMRGEEGGKRPDSRFGTAMAFLGQLPPEVRRPIADAFRAEKDNMRSMMDEVRSSRELVTTAITDETYDPAKVSALLADQRTKQLAVQQHVHEMLLKSMEGMTLEERKLISERVKQIFK